MLPTGTLSRKRPHPDSSSGSSIPHRAVASAAAEGTVASAARTRADWISSRILNLQNATALDAIAPISVARPADSAALASAIHARRMRRRINANLLVEADPIPIAQIKVVRGVVTTAVRATSATGPGSSGKYGSHLLWSPPTPEQAVSVALLDGVLGPLVTGAHCAVAETLGGVRGSCDVASRDPAAGCAPPQCCGLYVSTAAVPSAPSFRVLDRASTPSPPRLLAPLPFPPICRRVHPC